MKHASVSPQQNLISTSGRTLKSVLGWEFNTADKKWRLSKDDTLNMELIMLRAPVEYKFSIGKMFEHYAVTLASGTCLTVANALYHFFASSSGVISTDQLINFKANYPSATSLLQVLRPFFRRWHNFGYPGISSDVIKMLDGWRLPGKEKGLAIKRLDATEGPLTDFELSSFNDGVIFAYENGQLSLYHLSACLTLSCTGRRPIQITHLKCKDLVEVMGGDGVVNYFLHIPRAKQEGMEFREAFKTFQLTRELWDILVSHRQKTWSMVDSYGYELTSYQKGLFPLFYAPRMSFRDYSKDSFCAALDGDSLHVRTDTLNVVLKEAVVKLGIVSERTDDVLNVFARRFRYTMGTRAAREGVSKYVIAEILDHSDTQHVDVYTLNVPEHLKKIDEALGFQLARYAKAFTGNLVDSELDALRGSDPASRVKHRRSGVGTCGNFSYCGMNVPRPCYTCVNFQPWVDGPHEELYYELLDERELILAKTEDLAIAAILDRTIVAVAEVIRKCIERKKEKALG